MVSGNWGEGMLLTSLESESDLGIVHGAAELAAKLVVRIESFAGKKTVHAIHEVNVR
jgi:hypothetical protein